MLDEFVHATLYLCCVFGGIVAMWLATFLTDEDWPLWVVFAAVVLIGFLVLRRLAIPFPLPVGSP